MSYAIVLTGSIGSGKTTLARSISKELEIPAILSGDIARHLAEIDPETEDALSRGEWAPELAMRAEVTARIEEAVVSSGDFVIEGFPRKIEQLYILEALPGIIPLYFVLDMDPLLCLRRLILRGRDTDTEDSVAERLRAYEQETVPMIATIDSFCTILDGMVPLEETTDMVIREYWSAKNENSAVD